MPFTHRVPYSKVPYKIEHDDVTWGHQCYWWWTRMPTLNMDSNLTSSRNSKKSSNYVKFFRQNFCRSFIGLPPLRFWVLKEFATRDENSLFTVQVQFRLEKSLFEVNYKTRRHGKYQRLQKSSFKHVISHVQFVLALKVVSVTLMTFRREKF